MRQVLWGGQGLGTNNALDDTLTEFFPLAGGGPGFWDTNEFIAETIITTPGLIDSLNVFLNGSPGTGNSYAFTLRLNGANTALTVTISGSGVQGIDFANGVAVVAGDTVCLQCVPTSTPTVRGATWSTVFNGSVTAESLLLGTSRNNVSGDLNNAATEYCSLSGIDRGLDGTLANREQMIALPGSFKNLYVELDEDPGDPGGPDGYSFTVMLNGSATTLTLTISADNTTGNDTTHSFTVVATDLVTVEIVPINTPSATPKYHLGATFLADNDGESPVMGGSNNVLHASIQEFQSLYSGAGNVWAQSTSSSEAGGQQCTLKNWYVKLSASPGGTDDGYRFRLRSEITNEFVLDFTITHPATTGSDLVNVKNVQFNEEIKINVFPVNTPSATPFALWGMVQGSAQGAADGGVIPALVAAGYI